MASLIKAMLLVVIAEMGDKTQLLAMAMASKFKAGQVMLGVFIATIFNHALAVLVGTYLSSLIPMDTVKLVAGFAFLVFGLWTLRGDTYEEENKKKSKFGPVMTVAIAFFFAEMGDKTQLMTIAIAADSHQPLWILTGTTLGMMVADAIGILGGAWMCKNIPDKYMKWIPGLIFLFFGTLTVLEATPDSWKSVPTILVYFALLLLSVYLIGFKFKRRGPEIQTAEGFSFEACPYHHLLQDGHCPHLKLNKENQCVYSIESSSEKCPVSLRA